MKVLESRINREKVFEDGKGLFKCNTGDAVNKFNS
jgi:hypothetical protein